MGGGCEPRIEVIVRTGGLRWVDVNQELMLL